jgi:hypothetical protein
MRRITFDAVNAFLNNERFKKSNTQVINGSIYLHDNRIAWWEKGKVWISSCGYKTVTTKERLNGLPNVHIIQKNGEWFINGQRWDGTPICISNFE